MLIDWKINNIILVKVELEEHKVKEVDVVIVPIRNMRIIKLQLEIQEKVQYIEIICLKIQLHMNRLHIEVMKVIHNKNQNI